MRTRIDKLKNWQEMSAFVDGDMISVTVIWEEANEDLLQIDYLTHKEWVWRKRNDNFGEPQWQEVYLQTPVEFLRDKKIKDLLDGRM
jgi:hypothetical protein